jgi:hypothetical protein
VRVVRSGAEYGTTILSCIIHKTASWLILATRSSLKEQKKEYKAYYGTHSVFSRFLRQYLSPSYFLRRDPFRRSNCSRDGTERK